MFNVMTACLGDSDKQALNLARCAVRADVDVLCVQKVRERMLDTFSALYPCTAFSPMTVTPRGERMGLVTCSDHPVVRTDDFVYAGPIGGLRVFDGSTADRVNETEMRRLLVVTIVHEDYDEFLSIGNTHFPYSADGEPTEMQLQAVGSLEEAVDEYPALLLCGAMVVPRGRQLYSKLLESLGVFDLVPDEITSTLDPVLHRFGPEIESGRMPRVVTDYIMDCQSLLKFVGMKQFFGVCDHTPLLATFE